MREPGPRRAAAAAAALVWATGCSAAGEPASVQPSSATGTGTASPSAEAPAVVVVPADGVTMEALGFRFGPRTALSLPRSAVISIRVDQADGVTVVMSSPATGEVAEYLRRALPVTGFTITGDDQQGAAMTFTGYGWSGDFTGTAQLSALVLKP